MRKGIALGDEQIIEIIFTLRVSLKSVVCYSHILENMF